MRVSLRQFRGHSSAVHCVKFIEKDVVFSCSDDKVVSVWNFISEKKLLTLEGHTDFVRSGVNLQGSGGTLIATGSYDHTVGIWDLRMKQCAAVFENDAPVECLAIPSFNTSTTTIATSSGRSAFIWDLKQPRKPRESKELHSNTITSMWYSKSGLFTASLDKTVKVHSSGEGDSHLGHTIHSILFEDQILCGHADRWNEKEISVGTGTGVVRVRETEDDSSRVGRDSLVTALNYKNLVSTYVQEQTKSIREIYDIKQRKHTLYPIQKHLQQFNYKNALDAALAKEDPTLVLGLLEELKIRNETLNALDARDDSRLVPILKFCIEYIRDPRYSKRIIEFTTEVLEIYGSMVGLSKPVDKQIILLKKEIDTEIAVQKDLLKLQGIFDCLMITSSLYGK